MSRVDFTPAVELGPFGSWERDPDGQVPYRPSENRTAISRSIRALSSRVMKDP